LIDCRDVCLSNEQRWQIPRGILIALFDLAHAMCNFRAHANYEVM